tara:strand:- start:2955 stop:3461 length:507 start_codon:yes stop_codon:yes gene_type:complete
MKYSSNKRWFAERKLKNLPLNLKRLLIDNSSLTKRINKNNSQIKLISSQVNLTNGFGNNSKRFSFVRKVEINGNLDKPITAVSYTPVDYLKGKMICLKYLKEKSLASLLFKNPKFTKLDINYIVLRECVLRITIYKKNKAMIKVEEKFPKKNNYSNLPLIECRRKLIN